MDLDRNDQCGSHNARNNKEFPKWKRDKWDYDLFRATLSWELNSIVGTDSTRKVDSLNNVVEGLEKAIQNSSDVAGERITKTYGKRKVYWWSEELSTVRRR